MQRSTIPSNQDSTILQGVATLVLFVSVEVKEIARLGRSFQWPKPTHCPHCRCKLWWHGFVLAYFSSLDEAIYLRRLRCSRCGAVHRMRPQGYFPRFRSSINEILSSIKQRSHKKRWRPDLPRGRQHHWWRSLWGMIRLMLGMSFSGSGLEGFWQLFRLHIIPVTRAKQKENQSMK